MELFPDPANRPKIVGPDPHGFHRPPKADTDKTVNFLQEFLSECSSLGVDLFGLSCNLLFAAASQLRQRAIVSLLVHHFKRNACVISRSDPPRVHRNWPESQGAARGRTTRPYRWNCCCGEPISKQFWNSNLGWCKLSPLCSVQSYICPVTDLHVCLTRAIGDWATQRRIRSLRCFIESLVKFCRHLLVSRHPYSKFEFCHDCSMLDTVTRVSWCTLCRASNSKRQRCVTDVILTFNNYDERSIVGI